MATTAFVNTIGVRTDSYLYNHVLTTNSSNRDSTTYQSGKVISNTFALICSRVIFIVYPT